jgi:hypothetical protein
MSHGFQFFNSSGVLELSDVDYGFTILDHFTVAANSSGSKSYPDFGSINVAILQTQEEPSTVDKTALRSFSGLTINKSIGVGNSLVIGWSPKYADFNAYPVTLYILTV